MVSLLQPAPCGAETPMGPGGGQLATSQQTTHSQTLRVSLLLQWMRLPQGSPSERPWLRSGVVHSGGHVGEGQEPALFTQL